MSKKEENKVKDMFASMVIIICFMVAVAIFKFVMGAPSNFQDGNPQNEPVTEGFRSYLGTIYKGGFVVPILLTMLLMVFVFSVERFLTINKAAGKVPAHTFLNRIRGLLASGNLAAVEQECDKQQGSLGNVVKSAIVKYKEVELETNMDKDQKLVAIQKQIEEATELEMPMLQKNLIILSTLSTIGTLFALLGTVLGMIKAFKALSTAGAPDSSALATGISEALINTALGIFTSALAVISYNYFTTKIDGLTYSIDEAGFSIVNTYAQSHK